MSLGIADALLKERAAGHGLQRSVLFLFFTGEEQGLLGSDYWVSQPLWPLARTAGVLNLDANAPAGRPTRWRIAGDADAPLVKLVDRELQRMGGATSIAAPAPGSDYYPFLRRGVPAVFFVPSDGQYEGRTDAESDSMRASVWARYHRPNDQYSEQFPFEGLARYADVTRQILHAWDRVLDGRRTAAGASSGTR
jgi:Zn-dependent M28 family amino/carboxypeptidase